MIPISAHLNHIIIVKQRMRVDLYSYCEIIPYVSDDSPMNTLELIANTSPMMKSLLKETCPSETQGCGELRVV